ncbi:MAG: phosphatase PAP2 family protein [Bacilli bacterium]|nr:phosphatase PAP2 family protein [Bacilli bacterium]
MKNRKWFVLGLSIIFLAITILVKLNLLSSFDNFFYNIVAFNINDVMINIYKVITFLGSTTFIIAMCVFFLILFIILKKKNYGFIVAGVVIISTLVNNLIKIIIARERPLVTSFVTEHSYSFPSGHTMAATTLYGILLYFVLKSNMNKKLKVILSIVLGLLPVLVALSRVYLGAHFMSDVIGAIIASTILLLLETYFIDKKNWI